MTVIRSISRGLAGAFGAPRLVAWLWLLTLIAALPGAVMLRDSLADSIGSSQIHLSLRDSFDLDWWGEYSHRARGIEESFTPTRVSPAAVLENLESSLTGRLFTERRGLLAYGLIFAALWTLMVGGILDCLRQREGSSGLAELLAAGGRYFFRLLRLALTAGVFYYLIFRLATALFPWIERATRDVTVEKTVLGYNLLAMALIVFLLAFVNMAFGYAKIATVLEDRRSALMAAVRGFAFVFTHPLATLGVYWGLGALTSAVIALYFLLAPGVEGGTWPAVLWAFLFGQLYLLTRMALRVAFLGAQLDLYDSRESAAAR